MPNFSAASYWLAALAYGALALQTLVRLLRGPDAKHPDLDIGGSSLLLGALLTSSAWAVGGLLLPDAHSRWLETLVIPLLDGLRYAFWYAFLLRLLNVRGERWRDPVAWIRRGAWIFVVAYGALFVAREALGYRPLAWQQPQAMGSLALAIYGLVLLEQLLRNASGDARWNAKPVCLGLSTVFVFDLFLFSQAALFRNFDSNAFDARAAIHALAVPLLYVAARRRRDWVLKMHVSRAAVFHSATLLLAGAYLLLVAGVGYYVRYTGGDWGPALQLALVFVGLLALVALLLSGALRAKLRVYISKNFYSYRYDYREEWLRFTAMLSETREPQEMGQTVVRGLANLVESLGGALWLRRGGDTEIRQTARWNMVECVGSERVDSSLCRFMLERAWIIDLDEWRRLPARYEGLVLPDWLRSDARSWLLMPLLIGSDLIGFVVLGRPRTAIELDWEVRDLLKTAGRQAATFLAQTQATEALLESRKFDAFNKMSAFVVHDLKNIVTQLSLMMKNAKRLRDNPEFQQDMLDTVENSLEKMRQLMLQLREGETPHGVSGGVDLAAIAERLAAAAVSKGRALELSLDAGVATRGHGERIERVIGHMVQNAFDATPAEGRVWLRLDAAGSHARVEVGDTGCGMTREFIQNRLFKPFSTTKASGMGIGAYESYQYLQELGGKIDVDSEPEHGTRITILLPLFRAAQTSDLGLMGRG